MSERATNLHDSSSETMQSLISRQDSSGASPHGPALPSSIRSSLASSRTHTNNTATAESNHQGTQLPAPSNVHTKKNSLRILDWPKKALRSLRAIVYTSRRFASRVVWLKEVLSFLVSLIALGIIIIILAIHQDKALPKWPSLISINSLVSVFTSILKAAMLLPITEGISELKWTWFADPRPLSDMDRFDAASRGPLGSLKLFTNRHNFLASLGALITILALAIDPFTQQILQYYDCLGPLGGFTAMVVRTNNYTASGFHTGPLDNTLDGTMAATLYEGLLNPPANASASISVNCQSGNCTFPHTNDTAYSSLAMCADVDDISSHIRGNGTYGNYTIGPLSTYKNIVFQSSDITRLLGLPEHRPLFAFEALMVNEDCKSAQRPCPRYPWAFAAFLYPCIHSYGSVKVSDSIFQERILSTTSLPYVNTTDGLRYGLAGDYPSFPGTDCSPSQERQGNKTQPTSLLSNGLRYPVDQRKIQSAADMMWYDPACAYGFGQGSTYALSEYLGVFFGTLEKPNNLSLMYSAAYTIGDVWIQNLYANGTANLESTRAYMQGLANAITAVIRERGDISNSVPAKGTVLANKTCIRVVWAWLALPVALMLLTLAFFIATIVKSYQYTKKGATEGGRRAWKSSSLPLLWCGLDDELRTRHGGFDDLTSMDECANKVKVSLERRDEGLRRGWILKGP